MTSNRDFVAQQPIIDNLGILEPREGGIFCLHIAFHTVTIAHNKQEEVSRGQKIKHNYILSR